MVIFRQFNSPQNYIQTITEMQTKVSEILKGVSEEEIWLLEHQPIFTSGLGDRSLCSSNISGIDFVQTDRGGKVTCHMPGQRIIYLMLNVEKRGHSIFSYTEILSQCILETLNSFSIKAFFDRNALGIWIPDSSERGKKIAFFGLRIKKGVSYHGISVNISNDLSLFELITPCGLENCKMTSIYQLTKQKIAIEDFDRHMINNLRIKFE